MKKLILGYHKLLTSKACGEDIEKFLIEQGIEKSEIIPFKEAYDVGFKQGVNHVITGGLSSKELSFGQNPVFDSAFNMGRHYFLKESSFMYKYKPFYISLIFLVLGVAVAWYF